VLTSGLYRFSRNPMYIGVTLILWGWALCFRSRSLIIYAAAVMIAFHLRVLLYEEPWLARTYPDQWRDYRARVPRWLGRRRDRSGRLGRTGSSGD
jgi:protein-S-isoprenylcysteine O-methyltransferase Ste14